MCTKDMDEVLDILNFAPRDLWVAYKEFSLGSFYNDKAAEVRFFIRVSKFFRVFSVLRVFRDFRLFIYCLVYSIVICTLLRSKFIRMVNATILLLVGV
jgi:hypothetical protein